MNRSYVAFCGALVCLTVIVGPLSHRSREARVRFFPPPLIAMTDAESLLATGGKIALSTATPYELMLIPGISDIVADKIISARPAVLRSARHLPVQSQYRALTVVHGIGEKMAQKYERYIELK